MGEVVQVKDHYAQRSMETLHTVGFAEENCEYRVAVEDACYGVVLHLDQRGFAEMLQFAIERVSTLHGAHMRLPRGGIGGSRDDVVDDAFPQPGNPFIGNLFGDQCEGAMLAHSILVSGGE